MKTSSLVLTVSLAANLALAAAFFLRAPSTAPADGPNSTAGAAAAAKSVAKAASSDAALPVDAAQDAALGRAFARFSEKMRAVQAAGAAEGRWWRTKSPGSSAQSREQMLAARRELSEALLAAFGDDFGIGGTDNAQLTFLPAAKGDALRRITQDYDEMMAKFSASGIQLASDREKLRLLRAERDRDIAALLSPDELAAYEMRTSTTANTVRFRYGDAIESEDDFRKVYALQKAFDDKFPIDALTGRISSETMRARGEAERQLQADLRAALGDDKYAALRRNSDSELRALDSLVTRLNLPANTTDNIVAAREVFATESQRINADTSVPLPQRRAQIQELAARAKADLARTLGAEAAEAYAPRAQWLNMLQGGTAYSTTPQPGSPGTLSLGGSTQSVFPVMPAGLGAAVGGGTRQVIFSGSVSGPAEHAGGTLMMATPAGVPRAANMEVMTFTTAESTSVAAPVAGQPVIIQSAVVAQPVPPAAPATATPPKP